jgi:phosphoribosyl 1,2-cyclic phosphate phosphodiesterase
VRVTFLGTGAAGGVPLYGCTCTACEHALAEPNRVRRPCSALIEHEGTRVLIDAGLMDLHERFAPGALDAIMLTHFHPDHVQGLFHLRWGRGAPIAVYAPPDAEGCADLYKHPGLLDFRRLAKFEPQRIGALSFTPLPLVHSKPTFGYAVRADDGTRFAYLTDTLGLPPQTEAFLQAWQADGLAIDCSYPPQDAQPPGHNDWPMALAAITSVRPRKAWLTHIGHALDAWILQAAPQLPERVSVACDGEVAVLACGRERHVA